MTPLVSVLIPNLNYRSFLDERIDTIFGQTLRDWELVIVDNYSTDGAWEFFEEVARKDRRVRISQAPKQGMYANWNNCVRQATGRYIYIATSDDTMAPDCLEHLVAALGPQPRCGLAHCLLKSFDGAGRELPDTLSIGSSLARTSGDLFLRQHLRFAPLDGVLHLTGNSVYISITQLLIRRALFDQVGSFEGRWGSVGDFNWNMRATLATDTIHVPSTWGGWRIHESQATAAANLGAEEHRRKVTEMIDHAVEHSSRFLKPKIERELKYRWTPHARQMRDLYAAWKEVQEDPVSRRTLVLRHLLTGSWAAREHIKASIASKERWPVCSTEIVHSWLEKAGLHGLVQSL